MERAGKYDGKEGTKVNGIKRSFTFHTADLHIIAHLTLEMFSGFFFAMYIILIVNTWSRLSLV